MRQPLALTSPTWVRGLSRVLREGARPRGAENREKQNCCFSPKPCQVVAHARARVGKIRLFDQPYNPRMLTQESVTRTNPGKAEAKLEHGGAITLRNVRGLSLWPLGGLAAMGRMLGRLSRGFLLASPVWGERRKADGSDTPPLACARSDRCEGMCSRSPISAHYGALSVAGWV